MTKRTPTKIHFERGIFNRPDVNFPFMCVSTEPGELYGLSGNFYSGTKKDGDQAVTCGYRNPVERAQIIS
jgi:hypothetical protein